MKKYRCKIRYKLQAKEVYTLESMASRLKQVRGRRSAKEFATLIGCSMQTVYRYEWGVRTPDMDFLQTVSDKTGVSLDWLLGTDSQEDTPATNADQEHHLAKKQNSSHRISCPRCTELEHRLEKAEAKLDRMDEERREMLAEARKLYKEKEALLRENGALREKLARMESLLGILTDRENGIKITGQPICDEELST